MSRDLKTVPAVEDSAAARRVPSETLRGCGYRVAAARDGDDALCVARPAQPHLTVMDPNVPGPSGRARPVAPAGRPASGGPGRPPRPLSVSAIRPHIR